MGIAFEGASKGQSLLLSHATIEIDLSSLGWGGDINMGDAVRDSLAISDKLGSSVRLLRGNVSIDLHPGSQDDFELMHRVEQELLGARKPADPESVFLSMRSGASYYPLVGESRPTIPMDDLFIGLSRQARFNGQTSDFYSVAQHSVLVAQRVFELTNGDAESTMKALVHDMTEAFTGDMVTPLKALLPGFKELENRIDACLDEYFGLAHVDYRVIKRADLELLATEKRDQMPNSHEDWSIIKGVEPLPDVIVALPPDEAYLQFKEAFENISALVLEERAKQVARIESIANRIQKDEWLDAQCGTDLKSALASLNIRSPSNEVIESLATLHNVISEKMEGQGVDLDTANAVFMGRLSAPDVGANDIGIFRLAQLMNDCGEISRVVFERVSEGDVHDYFIKPSLPAGGNLAIDTPAP